MSNEKHETIADIVNEMRWNCPIWHMDGTRYRDGDWLYTKGMVNRLVDRIEAAEKRHCSDCSWYHVYNNGLTEMREENACFRAALKPVLECDCQLDNYPTKEAYMAALVTAVTEAQRIYNGGEERL